LGGALGEVWRHFQPAVAAQPIEAARSRRDSGRRSSALCSAKKPGTHRPDSSDVLEVTRLSTSGSLRAVSSGGGGGSSPTSRRRRPVRPSRRLHPPGRLETPAPWPGQGAARGPARRPRTRTAFVSAPVGSRRSAVRRKARRRRLFTHSVRFVKNHAVPSLKKNRNQLRSPLLSFRLRFAVADWLLLVTMPVLTNPVRRFVTSLPTIVVKSKVVNSKQVRRLVQRRDFKSHCPSSLSARPPAASHRGQPPSGGQWVCTRRIATRAQPRSMNISTCYAARYAQLSYEAATTLRWEE